MDLLVIALSVSILAFVLVRCAKAQGADALDLRFSLLVTTAATISYRFFLHNVTILLLPVLLAANHFAGPGRHAKNRVPFLISIVSMYFAPFLIPEPADMLVFFAGSGVLLLLVIYRSTIRGAAKDFRPVSRSIAAQGRTSGEYVSDEF